MRSYHAEGGSAAARAARARLQGSVLLADMAAFKAANPGAVLEDFVRWHSPRDWQPDDSHPLGGHLSLRMSSQVCPAARLHASGLTCSMCVCRLQPAKGTQLLLLLLLLRRRGCLSDLMPRWSIQ